MHAPLNRRAGLRLAAALAAALVLGAPLAQAADWPSKTVRLVVPFPPGGPTDAAARVVSQQLAERLGQPVVVDNRPGASGSIAAAQIKRSAADGYTLMMLATPTLLAPHLFKSAAYDVAQDFTPVATVYDLPIVIVVNPNELPEVTDLQQLIAHAKAQATPLNYTTAGIGSLGHLSMELLKQRGGFDMQHIPYNGTAPAITDTLGGRVPVMFADLVGARPHIEAGTLRAIAVGSPERVSTMPDVKTIAEQGVEGYSAVSWGGLLAPANVPTPVVERLSTEIGAILSDAQVQQQLLNAGALAHFEAPEQMAQRIAEESAKWGQVIQDNGIAME